MSQTPTVRPDSSWRFELTRIPLVRRVLTWRPLQFTLILVTLSFFLLAILTAFFGTQAGNRNFSIIFVWIVWWGLVIILMVPAAGRAWCGICPIPAPGEWLQRQSFVHPRRRVLWSLGKRWPRRLKNIWLQNGMFLTVALFSAIILTRPAATGIVLLAFILLAVGLSLVYERRTFCRYVCPVGGFIGLYSMNAPIELRVKDVDVCRTHDTKECYLGSEQGFGCPWLVFPGSLERNTYCGLCTECLKSCSMNNVVINLRPPGTDLFVAKGRRMDEAFKAFIMLACALAYSVVLLGPWGTLKDAANFVRLDWWLLYAAGFLSINLLILPGIFFAVAFVSRRLGQVRHVKPKAVFIDYAYTLVPLGLAAWIAFSLGFVLVNISYALPVIADPFGWGWNLLGLRDVPWTPVFPSLIPYIQAPVLLGGLAFAIYTAWRVAREHTKTHTLRAALPVVIFLAAATLGFLALYMA